MAVSLLVAILFFVNLGIELMLEKLYNKVSDHFGRAKPADVEQPDAAALVGTFKRYK